MPGARKRLDTECGARDTTEHGINDREDGEEAIYARLFRRSSGKKMNKKDSSLYKAYKIGEETCVKYGVGRSEKLRTIAKQQARMQWQKTEEKTRKR